MATTATKEVAGVVEGVSLPPALQMMVMPVEVTFLRPRPLHVILIGAGGTGARLGPDLARLLSRGDKLIIIDHDTVEERNLIRQHFIRRDVGKYKAEVVAQRALLAAGQGVEVEAKIMKLLDIDSLVRAFRTRGDGVPVIPLFIGAVDNRLMRQSAAKYLLTHYGIWIDAGNELRGGQVGMMAMAPATEVSNPNRGEGHKVEAEHIDHRMRDAGVRREQAEVQMCALVKLNTVAEVTPAILHPDAQQEGAVADCDVRLDTQSLAANVMAYAAVINLASRVLDGLPISSGSAFFSTQNTMTPVPFADTVRTPIASGGRHSMDLVVRTAKGSVGQPSGVWEAGVVKACEKGTGE